MGQKQSSCCSKSEQCEIEEVESHASVLDLTSCTESQLERGGEPELDSQAPGGQCELAEPPATVDLTRSTAEILRGVRLRDTMRRAGRIWRYRPAELSLQRRSRLNGHSHPVKHFDIFFSHTWLTPGRWKVLSLLLQRGCTFMLLAWSFGIALSFVLCMFDILPLSASWQSLAIGFRADTPVGYWLMVFGAIFALGGFLSAPTFAPGWSDICFLDVACIHQTDEVEMQQGINNIGSFLSASSELHVLWSGPYLSRLWCIFEIAAYRKLNPTGKIVISPMYVEEVLCQIYIWMHCFSAVYWYHRQGLADGPETMLVGGMFMLAGCSLLPAMHALRKGILSRHQLLHDLECFSIDRVDCTNDFDRQAIFNAIVRWYGSLENFSEYVRGPFRQEVLGIVKPCGFTLPYIFLATTPINALCLEGFLALCKGGAPAESILSYFVSVVVGNNMLWLPASMVFLDFVSKRIVSPSGRWNGHLQTLMIFLVMSALTMAGAMCAVGTYTGSVWLVFLWIGCAGIFASLVWYRCWHQ
ncbi:unnamed protein product [Symbiodinium microadriaticum]|nr:HERC1 [Symbiodinium sp. KB8]CAE7177241.1 unnamed protein product [Symbiodinium microadriaticum]